MNWKQRIRTAIAKRQAANELRSRTVIDKNFGSFLIFEGRRYINFSSNDYLGLSQHPDVIDAWCKNAKIFGVGSGSSGHIIGYTFAHRKLEDRLAQWLGYQKALLFISGFSANHAVITALATKGDRIIADRLSHASLLEAANISPAQLCRFVHNDSEHLKRLLYDSSYNGQQLVVTEGVFSMDGDSAPLAVIDAIAKQKNAWLMVDDAHGIGVLGHNGRGSCDMFRVKPELLIVTFGKSFGVSGAAVLCDSEVAEYLLQFARHLIYSTSMPPAQAMAIEAAISIICSDDGEYRRNCLEGNIRVFRSEASQLKNHRLIVSNSAIQSLIIGDNICALRLSNSLRDAGIWATAIRPPTVPLGTARLRITLTAMHTRKDIAALLEAIYNVS